MSRKSKVSTEGTIGTVVSFVFKKTLDNSV